MAPSGYPPPGGGTRNRRRRHALNARKRHSPLLAALLAGSTLALTACGALPQGNGPRQTAVATRIAPEDVQSELITFTDNYVAAVVPPVDRAIAAAPDIATRRRLHAAKISVVQSALTIASSANPIVALLDMTVMVSLQQRSIDHPLFAQLLGDQAPVLAATMRRLHDDIWRIASDALTGAQLDELQAVIDEIAQRSDGASITWTRASEFARTRQRSAAGNAAPGSIFQLFYLDPLAGLSPASREILESRLLAERVFFYASRMPNVINWQVRDLFYEFVSNSETQRLIASAEEASDATARATDLAEQLPDLVAQERQATIDQIFERLEAERREVFDQVAREREMIFARLDHDNAALDSTLTQLRVTIDAGNELLRVAKPAAEAATELTRAIDTLRTSRGEPDPNARPFDIAEYRAAAESIGAAVDRANATLETFADVLASPAWNERRAQIDDTLTVATARAEDVIDHAYRRGLTLVGVAAAAILVVGALLVALNARLKRRAP